MFSSINKTTKMSWHKIICQLKSSLWSRFFKATLKVFTNSISLVTAQGRQTWPEKETCDDKFSIIVFSGTLLLVIVSYGMDNSMENDYGK